ncbi:MAG: DUF948 domain-containing protein [Proteobacteria bacterium]|nr:DUF948 domain-containing protein [Pseudomonadota bacterium]
MDTILTIAQIIALFAVSALCFYLIAVALRLRDTLHRFQKDFSEVSEKAKPVLENLEVITAHFKSVSEKVDDQVEILRGSFLSLQDAAEDVVAFERRIRTTFEAPILRVAGMLGAIVDRLSSFFGRTRE